MALTSTDKQISSLIINKVPSENIYQKMIAQNLVNDDEIYIVQDNDKTVKSVNNKTGAVSLTASDVGAATMAEVNSAIQTAIGNAIGGSY